MTKNEIISAVRAVIAEQDLTRYQLAKLTGLRESTLQRVDGADWGQQIETLCKIAEAVGLEIIVRKRK